MNLIKMIEGLDIDTKILTAKKEQTDKKIAYVKEYVIRWAHVMLERDNITTINFIDCMCNAGIYQDGDCCTAVEVLMVFAELSEKYPQKKFRLFCNDLDGDKTNILRKIISTLDIDGRPQIKVHINTQDVNEYLKLLDKNPRVDGKPIFAYENAVILYVDPFDFGTVEIPRISNILSRHYCELIFNFFLSDYTRNITHDSGRISKCIGGNTFSNKEQLIEYMRSQLKVGAIKYLFTYRFKTQKNVELYQIVFATPNLKGLEKLKEVLWEVFGGAQFHRNHGFIRDSGQISLFSEEDQKQSCLSSYAIEGRDLLQHEFSGQEVSWADLERFLIEHTMLKDSHIIKNVLKPMLDSGDVQKCGNVGKSNFKHDNYRFL